ncbi:MAG: hypothetical protein IPO63_18385 [Bacteroidetes bacterium]|nr:hypothetical protein [Bacteroidota bacterium]
MKNLMIAFKHAILLSAAVEAVTSWSVVGVQGRENGTKTILMAWVFIPLKGSFNMGPSDQDVSLRAECSVENSFDACLLHGQHGNH